MEAIEATPAEESQRRIGPVAPRKKRRLGREAQTAIVMPDVEYTSEPSLTRRIWSGAVAPVPPTWTVWKYATYIPSGEKPRKLSSSSGLPPRTGAAGMVARRRLPDGPTRCHELTSRHV